MTAPTFTVPTIGDYNSTADANIANALTQIFDLLNGNLDTANIAASGVGTSELAASSVTTAKVATVPHVRVTGATNSCADSTFTSLTFPTETYDSEAMHSTSSNTERLTCVTAGLYDIGGTVEFSNAGASPTGDRKVILLHSSGATIDLSTQVSVTSLGCAVKVQTYYRLLAAEYVYLQAWQESGGPLAVSSSAFWMTWVGP